MSQMMDVVQLLFWAIAGCVLLPPLAKVARNWWSLHQAKKRVVRLGKPAE